MTIHNFYFAAAYGIWIYILLCLTVKLILDHHKRRIYARRERLVRQFFACNSYQQKEERQFVKIRRYVKSSIPLFVCACESYRVAQEAYAPAQHEDMAKALRVLFNDKSHKQHRFVVENRVLEIMAQRCFPNVQEQDGLETPQPEKLTLV